MMSSLRRTLDHEHTLSMGRKRNKEETAKQPYSRPGLARITSRFRRETRSITILPTEYNQGPYPHAHQLDQSLAATIAAPMAGFPAGSDRRIERSHAAPDLPPTG